MTKQRELTDKQQAFVEQYLATGDAYNSALAAGYSESSAKVNSCQFLRNPLIEQRLLNASREAEQKLGVTAEWRIAKLKLVIERSIPNEHGDLPAGVKQSDGISAIAELNKMLGDYTNPAKLKVTVDQTKDKLKDARKVYAEF